MAELISLWLPVDAAEPVLWRAAYDAARYGSYLRWITERVMSLPFKAGETYAVMRERWEAEFERAVTVVAAFKVPVEIATEPETLTVAFNTRSGETILMLRTAVHDEACRQAAHRTVRRWRAELEEQR